MKTFKLQQCSIKTKKVTTKYSLIYPCGSLVIVGTKKACEQIIQLSNNKNNEVSSKPASIDQAPHPESKPLPESDSTDETVQQTNRQPEAIRVQTEREKCVADTFKQISAYRERNARKREELGRSIEQTERNIEQGKRNIEAIEQIERELDRVTNGAYSKAPRLGIFDSLPGRIGNEGNSDEPYRLGDCGDSEDYRTIDI